MQKEFILTTDACTSGIAFILSQMDDQGREHVICYGGRGLRKSEINWSISELECLAIIEGTRCYHQYLVGRQNFAIYKSKPVAVILFWFTNFYRVACRISVIVHYCWIQTYYIYIFFSTFFIVKVIYQFNGFAPASIKGVHVSRAPSAERRLWSARYGARVNWAPCR